MAKIKKCLSCKFYRPDDEVTGRCRVDKGSVDHRPYPIMKHEDICDKWMDAGQNYYIRVGWVKSVKEKKSKRQDR